MATSLPLIRLLQLASPGLPVGMYSYSQGLEAAIHDGWLTTGADMADWLQAALQRGLGRNDAPILARLYRCWQQDDVAQAEAWSRVLWSSRETKELRDEDRQTGHALARLLSELSLAPAASWRRHPHATYAALFSLAAQRWRIALPDAVAAYLWSWLENQVLCAVKLAPLGQVAGQQLLHRLAQAIPGVVEQALALSDDDIGGSLWGVALASSRHEQQYSRLFRS